MRSRSFLLFRLLRFHIPARLRLCHQPDTAEDEDDGQRMCRLQHADAHQLLAVGRAAGGNMKAYELVRDTYGDKPVEKVQVEADVTTDADRALMASIAARLDENTHVEVVKDIKIDTE